MALLGDNIRDAVKTLRRGNMKENIKQMRERHEREITALQMQCKHKKSTRMPYEWAPGHFSDVEVCDFCGAILKMYQSNLPFATTWPGSGCVFYIEAGA